jgi:succinyl-CoA synthetase beta subunit
MDIHEFQSKALMASFGLPVGEGLVVKKESKAKILSESESNQIDSKLDEMFAKTDLVVVKAQVLAGGRGKAGGVKLFKKENKVQASEYAKKIIGTQLVTHQTDSNGQFVSSVYFEAACDISRELYLSFILNRESDSVSIIASTEGGMDIEEVSAKTPEKIKTMHIEPITGYQSFYAKDLCLLFKLDLKKYFKSLDDMLRKLYKMFIEKDISLLEINPLVVTKNKDGSEGDLRILDAKISIDDNALWRQKDLHAMRDSTQENDLETKAIEAKLSYVKLDGKIGCMVNGAGLAMATMDIIKFYGGSPANFLDVGGGASKDGVKIALDIIFSDPDVQAVLINIFGGIVRCDMIAEAAIGAVNELKQEGKRVLPIVIRLSGTNSKEGMELIKKSGLEMTPAESLDDAALKAVKICG